MEDGFETEATAAMHFREQIRSKLVKLTVTLECGFEHAGEHVVVQQLSVLGKHAEDELVYEMRYRKWRMPLLPQFLRQIGKLPRNFLGDRFASQARLKPVRFFEYPGQLLPSFGKCEICKFD